MYFFCCCSCCWLLCSSGKGRSRCREDLHIHIQFAHKEREKIVSSGSLGFPSPEETCTLVQYIVVTTHIRTHKIDNGHNMFLLKKATLLKFNRTDCGVSVCLSAVDTNIIPFIYSVAKQTNLYWHLRRLL